MATKLPVVVLQISEEEMETIDTYVVHPVLPSYGRCTVHVSTICFLSLHQPHVGVELIGVPYIHKPGRLTNLESTGLCSREMDFLLEEYSEQGPGSRIEAHLSPFFTEGLGRWPSLGQILFL